MKLQLEDVSLRRFTFEDIPLKIQWINDAANNKYLHYDLPLEYDKTYQWFKNVKDRTDRFDAVIEYKGIPVGITGLLSIDQKNKKAEDYITIGNRDFLHKGIAKKAGLLNAYYGFHICGINKIYAYIEKDNLSSLNLYLSKGFEIEGYLKDDLYYGGRYVDRYVLGARKHIMLQSELAREIKYE